MDVIEKAVRTILSCKTEEQLEVSIRYAQLAYEAYKGVDRLGKVVIPVERALAVKRYQLGLIG